MSTHAHTVGHIELLRSIAAHTRRGHRALLRLAAVAILALLVGSYLWALAVLFVDHGPRLTLAVALLFPIAYVLGDRHQAIGRPLYLHVRESMLMRTLITLSADDARAVVAWREGQPSPPTALDWLVASTSAATLTVGTVVVTFSSGAAWYDTIAIPGLLLVIAAQSALAGRTDGLAEAAIIQRRWRR